MVVKTQIKSLPNNKMLVFAKLKVFVDDKFNVAKTVIFVVCNRVENIAGKGENAGKHFPLCFQKFSVSKWLKFWIVWKRVNQ